VEIQERGGRAWTQGCVACKQGIGPHASGDFSRGAGELVVLAEDFHLENFVGLLPGLDAGVSHEGDQAFLEGAEAAFNLALGLGSGSDEVGDAKGAQGALELAFGVGVVIAGTWPEKTQAVGVNDLGDAARLEGLAEVQEVVPGRVGGDETPRHVEAGMVVNGEQEGLLVRRRPPLVDGAVVLPEFSDLGAAEASIDTIPSWWRRDEVGEVAFDVGLDGRTGAGEEAKAFEFVADKLVVGRVLHGQETFEEGADFGGPEAMAVASAGLRAVGDASCQPEGPHSVELGSAYAELGGGGCGVQEACVELIEGLEDELRGEAVNDLVLFKSAESSARTYPRDQLAGHLAGTLWPIRPRRLALRRPSLRSGLLRASLRGAVCPLLLRREIPFCSVYVPFCSGPDKYI